VEAFSATWKSERVWRLAPFFQTASSDEVLMLLSSLLLLSLQEPIDVSKAMHLSWFAPFIRLESSGGFCG
jgi:hypothetical protein